MSTDEDVFIAVIGGGHQFAGFGDGYAALGTFEGSTVGGDEGDTTVLAAATGIVIGDGGIAEVRLTAGPMSGVLVAVTGLGVGKRSPRAITAEGR